MKTVHLRDEHFAAICDALDETLAGMEMSISFLIHRFGPESDQVKAETARFAMLTAAESDFRNGSSSWQGAANRRTP